MEFADHLHWAQAGDCVFLMDARRGEYFGLDPDASRTWIRLARTDTLDESNCDAELSGILVSARTQGWLASPDAPPAAARPTQPSRVWQPFPGLDAYFCLVRAFLSLRFRGFGRTYHWARMARMGDGARSGTATEGPALDRALAHFTRAETFILSRLGFDDCLPRSLALYVFLRRSGLAVRHRIGIFRYPFGAHAWVEFGERPLLNQTEALADCVPIATICP